MAALIVLNSETGWLPLAVPGELPGAHCLGTFDLCTAPLRGPMHRMG